MYMLGELGEPYVKVDATIRGLMRILTGDPVDAMESAKKIVGGTLSVDVSILVEIVRNRQYRSWSRIAAIYALGFLNEPSCARILISVMGSRDESSEVRSHAAEALGNMRASRAVPALAKILLGNEKTPLKKWCIYALSEIGNSKSQALLVKFAATKPRGKLAKELSLAFRRADRT
jgi:hypothetical protein